MSAPAVSSTHSKDNPFPARLTENRLLSRPGSGKETRHFVVNLAGSGLHYKAGDSLGVYPTNRAEDVAEILSLLGATGSELVSPAMLKLPAPLPLREVLETRLTLSGPTKKILDTLAAKTTDAAEKARLAELLAPEAKEKLQAYLDDREYVDILSEFRGAKLTPQEFVDHLRKLMPRLYSIASSSKVYPTEIHLTVAIVRYETNGRKRYGVCSTFLADRAAVGQTPVPVFVSDSHFGPPADTARDCIMVGPGTGIAPFRAFVQDRVASGATGRNWVFFGDQKAATDFLYEEEWTQYLAEGKIARLDLAWSRDQAQKIYVQDKMRAAAVELWKWISGGGHFYVCGDAKRMAKDVDLALHEIIAQQGGMDTAAAADYVKAMKKEGRYQRDVY
ncbi:sulfite reductase subunit alpha [Nibricoccus sp. IMCC34717]|uniref:sulfite reductase subunit alpha n=1 Tax=Nibricoccus sp. IMCC34717 TaxID=3034021 RepID=UPI00384E8A5D